MSKIDIKNLSFSYHNRSDRNLRRVLEDINLKIEDGETVGIIGSNGVGKSTLLKLLAGIEPVAMGTIRLFDMELNKNNLAEIRKRTGYVFQDSDSQLFMSTVYEDVAFAPENYGLSKSEAEERTWDSLKKVHMEHLAHKKIYQLSGGEKKLASIATVLPMQPDVIFFDEPSVALDPQNRRNLIHILNEIKTIKVIASHDLDFIYDTCERTILLSNGKIIADSCTGEILKNQSLLEEHGLELPLSFSRMKL